MHNKLEVRIFGPRRSGNHAIINWLAYQAPAKITFFNCASNRGHDPYKTGKNRGDRYTQDLQDCFHQIPKLKHVEPKMLKSWRERDKDLLMYSYEDIFFDKYVLPHKGDFPLDRENIIGTSEARVDIIILRDVYNWLASKLKFNSKKKKPIDVSIIARRYKRNRDNRLKMPYFDTYPGWQKDGRKLMGRVYINIRKMMNVWKSHIHAKQDPEKYGLHNVVFINYNKWATNYEYRKDLINNELSPYGFEFTDKGKDQIAVRGGGSTFDGLGGGEITDANRLDVLNRWKHFAENKLYERIFEFYPDAVQMNQDLFGPVRSYINLVQSEENEPNLTLL